MINTSTEELVKFLKGQNSNAKFLDKLKIVYRPYICPFDELLSKIDAGKSVFDVGCGSGQFLSLVCKFRSPISVKGIEIAKILCDNAQTLLTPYKNDINVSIEKYNGDVIPNDIESYDYITMIDVAHHIPKDLIEPFFNQLFKKMKKGAILIYKDINGASPLVLANKVHDAILAGEIGNELSLKKTSELFTSIGFNTSEITKKRLFWYPHFTIIASK